MWLCEDHRVCGFDRNLSKHFAGEVQRVPQCLAKIYVFQKIRELLHEDDVTKRPEPPKDAHYYGAHVLRGKQGRCPFCE